MMNRTIIGVDEVGRGCLAGPVVCAAVVLPARHRPWIDQVKDSKRLSAKNRQLLSEYILDECVYAIAEGSRELIDTENILQATLQTMRACVESVIAQGVKADFVLVDGHQKIPGLKLPQEAIKGGDDLHKAIGAASIIAKVYRDNYMVGMDQFYPEYGFCRNVGYGTKEHIEAIYLYGPCKLHRQSFKPVKDLI